MTDQFLHPIFSRRNTNDPIPIFTLEQLLNLKGCFMKYFWSSRTHPGCTKVRNIIWSVRDLILKDPIRVWLMSTVIDIYQWHNIDKYNDYHAEIVFSTIMQTLYDVLTQEERNLLRTDQIGIYLEQKIKRELREKYNLLKEISENDFPLLCEFITIFPYQHAQNDALIGLLTNLESESNVSQTSSIHEPSNIDDVLEFLKGIPYGNQHIS